MHSLGIRGKCVGMNSYRTPPETGPTPKADLAAARVRVTWQSFWKAHKDLADILAGCFTITAAVLAFVGVCCGIGACIDQVRTENDTDCRELCRSLGADQCVRSGSRCYCVDDRGEPWAWHEWPGVDGGGS